MSATRSGYHLHEASYREREEDRMPPKSGAASVGAGALSSLPNLSARFRLKSEDEVW